MRSEGYGSRPICLTVCLSHLTSGASVRRETAVMYSVGNVGRNICGVFSETASF